MKSLAHLATRVFDCPVAIQPGKLETIVTALGDRFGLEFDAADVEAARATTSVDRRSYEMTREGVAVVPIQGTLMKRASGMMAMSGCSSYEQIGASITSAVNDPSVKGIVLDVDSPGGECHGLFELANAVSAMRGQKPLAASVNDSCYSAAFALACCADKIFVSMTGGVGSVGVVSMHVDQSGADAKNGYKFTYTKGGDKKTDGNSHEPLSDSAQADIQAEVDRQYGMFVDLVSRNRNVSAAKIRGTQAGCFYGEQAIPLLADQVGTLDDAIAYVAGITSPTSTLKGNKMTKLDAETEVPSKTLAAKADSETEDMETKKAKAEDEEDEYQASVEDDDDEDSEEDKKATKAMKAVASLTRIVNLCALAGVPEKAADFINRKVALKHVEKALLAQRAEKSKAATVKTTVDPSLSASPAAALERIQQGATALAKEKGISRSAAYQQFVSQNPGLYEQALSKSTSKG